MKELIVTLAADGETDQALEPIVEWVLRQHRPDWGITLHFVSRGHRLERRIPNALGLYPCNLLCIHRDAEAESPASRRREIREIMDRRLRPGEPQPYVSIVPVRMTEAWLLFDERAIRCAAGNPNGKMALNLPKLSDVEGIEDPKAVLRNALDVARELPARRRRSGHGGREAIQVAWNISDYSPLRELPAFREFERELQDARF